MREIRTFEQSPIENPLLPVQFLDLLRRRHSLEGSKLLAFSILKDALECYMKPAAAVNRNQQKLFRDAERWINRKGGGWLFSFDSVCEILDIDPSYLRRGLRSYMKHRHLNG